MDQGGKGRSGVMKDLSGGRGRGRRVYGREGQLGEEIFSSVFS